MGKYDFNTDNIGRQSIVLVCFAVLIMIDLGEHARLLSYWVIKFRFYVRKAIAINYKTESRCLTLGVSRKISL